MRENHHYSGNDYRRENGIGLAWIVRKCFMRGPKACLEEEIKEYNLRHDNERNGKIIGKPARKDAYLGKSAVYHWVKSVSEVEERETEDKERQIGNDADDAADDWGREGVAQTRVETT